MQTASTKITLVDVCSQFVGYHLSDFFQDDFDGVPTIILNKILPYSSAYDIENHYSHTFCNASKTNLDSFWMQQNLHLHDVPQSKALQTLYGSLEDRDRREEFWESYVNTCLRKVSQLMFSNEFETDVPFVEVPRNLLVKPLLPISSSPLSTVFEQKKIAQTNMNFERTKRTEMMENISLPSHYPKTVERIFHVFGRFVRHLYLNEMLLRGFKKYLNLVLSSLRNVDSITVNNLLDIGSYVCAHLISPSKEYRSNLEYHSHGLFPFLKRLHLRHAPNLHQHRLNRILLSLTSKSRTKTQILQSNDDFTSSIKCNLSNNNYNHGDSSSIQQYHQNSSHSLETVLNHMDYFDRRIQNYINQKQKDHRYHYYYHYHQNDPHKSHSAAIDFRSFLILDQDNVDLEKYRQQNRNNNHYRECYDDKLIEYDEYEWDYEQQSEIERGSNLDQLGNRNTSNDSQDLDDINQKSNQNILQDIYGVNPSNRNDSNNSSNNNTNNTNNNSSNLENIQDNMNYQEKLNNDKIEHKKVHTHNITLPSTTLSNQNVEITESNESLVDNIYGGNLTLGSPPSFQIESQHPSGSSSTMLGKRKPHAVERVDDHDDDSPQDPLSRLSPSSSFSSSHPQQKRQRISIPSLVSSSTSKEGSVSPQVNQTDLSFDESDLNQEHLSSLSSNKLNTQTGHMVHTFPSQEKSSNDYSEDAILDHYNQLASLEISSIRLHRSSCSMLAVVILNSPRLTSIRFVSNNLFPLFSYSHPRTADDTINDAFYQPVASILSLSAIYAISHSSHITTVTITDNTIGDSCIEELCRPAMSYKNGDVTPSISSDTGSHDDQDNPSQHQEDNYCPDSNVYPFKYQHNHENIHCFDRSRNGSLHYLDFSNNNVSFRGLSCLSSNMKQLASTCTLSTLKLNSNPSIGNRGAILLAEALSGGPLNECDIHQEGAEHIFKALEWNQQLEQLEISNNLIGPEILSMLAQTIKNNQHLDLLNIDGVGIGSQIFSSADSKLEDLTDAIVHNPTILQDLSLCHNDLGNPGGVFMAHLLRRVLEHHPLSVTQKFQIFLSGNRMSDQAAAVWKDLFRESYNIPPLTSSTMSRRWTASETGPSSYFMIKCVDLRNNMFGTEESQRLQRDGSHMIERLHVSQIEGVLVDGAEML